jgi:hypothetical protein
VLFAGLSFTIYVHFQVRQRGFAIVASSRVRNGPEQSGSFFFPVARLFLDY